MPKKSKPQPPKEPAKKGLIRAAQYVRMSTEHQRYSIERQSENIRQFALANGMKVVRSYEDSGKSGLQLKGRQGLQALLTDVDLGQNDYSVILVYDVSRWGRFQDYDEAAYHEYLCKRRGLKVIYCSEPAESDISPMTGIIKSIRRAMAAEFSRELSVRVWDAQRRIVERGFKPGGRAGYGLRRMLVDERGKQRQILEVGDRKGRLTDRVILTPGPAEETAIVRRIFDWYVKGESLQEIVDRLNKNRTATKNDLVWYKQSVSQVLSSHKYVGDNIFNRRSIKLKGEVVHNPPEKWIRKEGAFEAIVSRDTFNQAQEIRSRRARKWSQEELLGQLQRILKEKGDLSSEIINADPDTPDSSTYTVRFGSLAAAMEAAGYCRIKPQRDKPIQILIRRTTESLIAKIESGLIEAGLTVDRNVVTDVLTVNGKLTLSAAVARSYDYSSGTKWNAKLPRCCLSEFVVLARMKPGNRTFMDYYLIPQHCCATFPRETGGEAKVWSQYRLRSINALYSWCRAV